MFLNVRQSFNGYNDLRLKKGTVLYLKFLFVVATCLEKILGSGATSTVKFLSYDVF